MKPIEIRNQFLEILPEDQKPFAPQFAPKAKVEARLAGQEFEVFIRKQFHHRLIVRRRKILCPLRSKLFNGTALVKFPQYSRHEY
jgi:hypothetical protein